MTQQIKRLTKEQAQENVKRKQAMIQAGVIPGNIKIDGSWGPWLESRYEAYLQNDSQTKPIQEANIGAAGTLAMAAARVPHPAAKIVLGAAAAGAAAYPYISEYLGNTWDATVEGAKNVWDFTTNGIIPTITTAWDNVFSSNSTPAQGNTQQGNAQQGGAAQNPSAGNTQGQTSQGGQNTAPQQSQPQNQGATQAPGSSGNQATGTPAKRGLGQRIKDARNAWKGNQSSQTTSSTPTPNTPPKDPNLWQRTPWWIKWPLVEEATLGIGTNLYERSNDEYHRYDPTLFRTFRGVLGNGFGKNDEESRLRLQIEEWKNQQRIDSLQKQLSNPSQPTPTQTQPQGGTPYTNQDSIIMNNNNSGITWDTEW